MEHDFDSVDNIVGSLWGRIEIGLDESVYSQHRNQVMNDLTVEVIKKYEMETTYGDDDTHTIPEDYVEVLTDEGKTEVWILSSFVLTHYRLPGR